MMLSNPQLGQNLYSPIYNNSFIRNTKTIRRKFSPEEDEKLRLLVEKQGPKKWDQIAKEMPGRTGRQCRDRYKNYLVPGFFNGQWSEEEDKLLLEMYLQYGSQWSKLSKFFKNRSANSLKNRWNYFVLKKLDRPVNDKNEEKCDNNITDNKNDSIAKEENQQQENKFDTININVVDFQLDPQLFVDPMKERDNVFIPCLDANISGILDFDFCF